MPIYVKGIIRNPKITGFSDYSMLHVFTTKFQPDIQLTAAKEHGNNRLISEDNSHLGCKKGM
jgi:hypothetical protein